MSKIIPKNIINPGKIIGIAGKLGSGKDTVASMINYIFHVGTTQCSFNEWLTRKIGWDEANKDRIIHFADKLKDCLSIIYNIHREDFDDREKKDNLWYSLKERRYITEQEASNIIYVRIYIEDLKNNSLRYIIESSHRSPVIKIRTLMQYFGTEIGREQLDSNIWVDSTMTLAADIAETRQVCIIPDVRFISEHSAICKSFLYGGDIEVIRGNSGKIEHYSENIDFKCSTIIENNGSKLQLFYKVLSFVQTIKAKKDYL